MPQNPHIDTLRDVQCIYHRVIDGVGDQWCNQATASFSENAIDYTASIMELASVGILDFIGEGGEQLGRPVGQLLGTKGCSGTGGG